MKRIILFVLYCSLHHTMFAQTVDLATGNNSVRIRAGNANTVFDNNQILFSYYSGTSYSHAIKTRHDGGGQVNNSIDFYVWKPGDAVTGVGSNHVMSLNGGNVGIGTTSPAAKLDVGAFIPNGTLGSVLGRLQEGNTIGSGTYLGIKGYGTQTTDYGGKAFALEHSFYGVTNNSISFHRGSSEYGGFMTFNTHANIERVRINGDGNVGIGTTTPDSKLAVNGTIHSKEVKVDMNNWPDYVFEPTYTLPSLDSVQSYINQNKHLPEVPSAKEMEANGVNLGEMNMLLLKKVEELTLYVIELKKENSEFKKELKKIANKN